MDRGKSTIKPKCKNKNKKIEEIVIEKPTGIMSIGDQIEQFGSIIADIILSNNMNRR